MSRISFGPAADLTGGTGAATQTYTVDGPRSREEGAVLYAFWFSSDAVNNTIVSCSFDGQPGEVVASVHTDGIRAVACCRFRDPSPGTGKTLSLTANGNMSGNRVVAFLVFGANLDEPNLKTVAANASSTTPSGTSNMRQDEYLVGASLHQNASNPTNAGGQTSLVANNNGSFGYGVAFKPADSTGSSTLSWTVTSSPWQVLMVPINEATQSARPRQAA